MRNSSSWHLDEFTLYFYFLLNILTLLIINNNLHLYNENYSFYDSKSSMSYLKSWNVIRFAKFKSN